jgi:hypothetical protein
VDATFAGNPVAGSEPCAEQVAQLLDCLAAGDVQATIKGLEPVLTHHRRALAARDELQARVSPKTLNAALELRRRRVGPG